MTKGQLISILWCKGLLWKLVDRDHGVSALCQEVTIQTGLFRNVWLLLSHGSILPGREEQVKMTSAGEHPGPDESGYRGGWR